VTTFPNCNLPVILLKSFLHNLAKIRRESA
jgi:hypothetical protein